jgi:hypothetical protein
MRPCGYFSGYPTLDLPGTEEYVQEICGDGNHHGQDKCPEKDDSCTKNALKEIFNPDVLSGVALNAVRSFTFGPSWPGWQYQHESNDSEH